MSENIILGQLCPLGTGAFDLLLDDHLLATQEEHTYGGEEEGDMMGEGPWAMTPGRATPGHMTPGRTPHRTPQ